MRVQGLSIGMLVAALAIAPAVTAAQSTTSRAPGASAAGDSVAALEHRLEAALTAADTSFLESVLADDFLFASADGVTLQKALLIKTFARPGRFEARRLTALHVEPHGDIALTKGRLEVEASGSSHYTVCYVRLYAQRNHRWQLVSHHTFRELMGSFAETCAPK